MGEIQESFPFGGIGKAVYRTAISFSAFSYELRGVSWR